MKVSQAVDSRMSVRAFKDKPVDGALLRRLIEHAARAPSGGNLQPWRLFVLGGDAMIEFKTRIAARLTEPPTSDPAEYEIYPPKLWDPYRTERFDLGEQMYALLNIPREDKAGRLRQMQRNFEFFGAPTGLFCYVDRRMGPPQWSDLGMYLQTLMLLLREHDLHSCPQEIWSTYPATIAEFLKPPEQWMLFCGMAIGYCDEDAPVNTLRSRRLPLAEFAEFRGL